MDARANNQPHVAPNGRKTKELTKNQRLGIYWAICIDYNNGKLHHGFINKTAEKLGVSWNTICVIWRSIRTEIVNGVFPPSNVVLKNNFLRGRKPKFPKELLREHAKTLPLCLRANMKILAAQFPMYSYSGIRHLCKDKRDPLLIKRTCRMVPVLSQENRQARLDYCLSFVRNDQHFDSLYDCIWIDEKKFQVHPSVIAAYLAPDKRPTFLPTLKKNHLVTVTFLAAVARPRRNAGGQYDFNGLIGIWPFVATVPAQRSSRNRPRGTPETKDIKIDIATFEDFYVEKLLPAVQACCPDIMKQEFIYIQMDNAPVHKVSVETQRVHEFYKGEPALFPVPVCQPPNSPDLNILDLGVFRTLQCLVSVVHCRNMDEVIVQVTTQFFALDP